MSIPVRRLLIELGVDGEELSIQRLRAVEDAANSLRDTLQRLAEQTRTGLDINIGGGVGAATPVPTGQPTQPQVIRETVGLSRQIQQRVVDAMRNLDAVIEPFRRKQRPIELARRNIADVMGEFSRLAEDLRGMEIPEVREQVREVVDNIQMFSEAVEDYPSAARDLTLRLKETGDDIAEVNETIKEKVEEMRNEPFTFPEASATRLQRLQEEMEVDEPSLRYIPRTVLESISVESGKVRQVEETTGIRYTPRVKEPTRPLRPEIIERLRQREETPPLIEPLSVETEESTGRIRKAGEFIVRNLRNLIQRIKSFGETQLPEPESISQMLRPESTERVGRIIGEKIAEFMRPTGIESPEGMVRPTERAISTYSELSYQSPIVQRFISETGTKVGAPRTPQDIARKMLGLTDVESDVLQDLREEMDERQRQREETRARERYGRRMQRMERIEERGFAVPFLEDIQDWTQGIRDKIKDWLQEKKERFIEKFKLTQPAQEFFEERRQATEAEAEQRYEAVKQDIKNIEVNINVESQDPNGIGQQIKDALSELLFGWFS